MLTVNDQFVNFDLEKPTHWSISIPIEAEETSIEVVLSWNDDTTVESSQMLFNYGDYLYSSEKVIYDEANHRAFVSDGALDAIVEVDLTTGGQTIISSADVGDGDVFSKPTGLTLDADNNRLFVVDSTLDVVFEVNITSGDRNIISTDYDSPADVVLDAAYNRLLVADMDRVMTIALDGAYTKGTLTDGSGSSDLERMEGIALDVAGNRAVVVDRGTRALVAIDLESGDRNFISNNDIESDINFMSPDALSLDLENEQIFVVDYSLVSVDVTTGERTLVSSNDVGEGVPLFLPSGLALDTLNNHMLITDDLLLSVDLNSASGTYADRELATFGVGTGPHVFEAIASAYDPVNHQLFVSDDSTQKIVSVDLNSGNRTEVSSENLGSGAPLKSYFVIYDADEEVIYSADYQLDTIVKIDVATGDREILSDNSIDSEIDFTGLYGAVELDKANNRMFVYDQIGSIISVDLSTGVRTLISSAERGAGEADDLSDNWFEFAYDADNNRIFIANANKKSVYEVDVASGDRRVVSDNISNVSDISFDYPSSIAFDEENQRLYLVDTLVGVFSINIDTGERTLLLDLNSETIGLALEPYDLSFTEGFEQLYWKDYKGSFIQADLLSGEVSVISK